MSLKMMRRKNRCSLIFPFSGLHRHKTHQSWSERWLQLLLFDFGKVDVAKKSLVRHVSSRARLCSQSP